MIELTIENRARIAPLFDGWEETMIWSCLQGCMGRAWADSLDAPRAAQIDTGDLIFLAGDAASPGAEELVRHLPVPAKTRCPVALVVPRDEAWASRIEQIHGEHAQRGMRYAIQKESPAIFDREKLRAYCGSLPHGFRLAPIDCALYKLTQQTDWAFDFCSQFDSWEDYRQRGVGFVALHDGKLAAGASSYTVYNGGIEIEIGTKEEFRRRGLARACGAALILRCLDLGLYPSWDAANPASVALSETLGYHFSHEYPYYAISRE